MEIKQCFFNQVEEQDQLVVLQNIVYQSRGISFSRKTFQHWYVDNPDGPVISFNAFDNGNMIAHQSFVPEKMLVDGRIVRCLRSMAVVTHPKYTKKGIFSKLTNLAVEEARRQGYEFIYAITNENSFPAFIKHCGFTFITRLKVKAGFGNHIKEKGDKTYKRYWSKDSLRWRLASSNAYRKSKNNILGRYKGITTYMGHLDQHLLKEINIRRGSLWGIRLYVGIGASLPLSYFNVPKFIKHSPFNLIFKDLSDGKIPLMTQENIFIQLLDFDVA